MRLLALLLIISTALAAALPPLPGVSSVPDGTEVVIFSADAQSKLAKGAVKTRVLTLTALNDKLNQNEKVEVWLGVPTKPSYDLKSFSFTGTVSKDGTDVNLEIANNKVSFTQTLKEAYNVKLEWKK
jgi:hypothetical protein